MTDFQDRLRERMRAEVSGVQPEERLTAIRRRTEQPPRPSWWVPVASGLAALGLVTAAVVGVATSRDGAVPGQAAGTVVTTHPSKEPTGEKTTGDEGATEPSKEPTGEALPASVYLTSPTDVTTDGPLRVTGEANTFEATVNWRVLQDGDVVREGYAMGGSYGEWRPFHFTVRLPPGEYTVEVFEASAKDGSQQSLNTVQVTVD